MPRHTPRSRPVRLLGWGLLGLFALLFGLLLLTPLWPERSLNAWLDEALSDYTGMQADIQGARLQWLPRPRLRTGESRLTGDLDDDDAPGLRARAASVTLSWRSLLRGQVAIQRLELEAPVLILHRDRDGALFPDPRDWRDPDAAPGHIRLGQLTVDDGTLIFRDAGRAPLVLEGFSLTLDDLRRPAPPEDGTPFHGLHLKAEAAIDRLHYGDLLIADTALTLDGDDGTLTSSDLAMTWLHSRGQATFRLALGAQPAQLSLTLELPDLQAEAIPEAWRAGQSLRGIGRVSLTLDAQGASNAWPGGWPESLDGALLLEGRDIHLEGFDLDEELSRYRRTQRFNLTDVGAVLLAGPAGLAATKGGEFARLLDRADGDTTLTRVHSHWTLEDGVATAADVALATTRNRVAARGQVDFGARELRDLEVAVVNQEGCAVIRQRVYGSFDDPQVNEPSIIDALLGAPLDLLDQGLGLLRISSSDCDAFYDGEVAAPEE
ncbi:AsmA family protein [Isoalcanivorax indicus]|uniref:AsmA family protein n=1 Tax=Isoalcanivorax indicus TaxID=2202653 RepID=UPI000DB9492E|nr:AsmA-like C-terminal region-containing protein [Isoalcanivorax indicus]